MTSYKDNWEKLENEPIGQGGQGLVYKVARKSDVNKKAYIAKVFKKSNSTTPERLARFKREAEISNSLSHEHIIKIIEFDVDIEHPYLIMEHCSGGSLNKAKNPFWQESPLKALELFQQICLAVAEAHKNGIIHRDLKPENILLRTERGPAVVSDFGICYLQDGERLTEPQERVGAKYYMAPEQSRGRETNVNNKCDIYSLGKILHWLLSGKDVYREEHLEPEYNLRSKYDEKMEYVNQLLDKMIKFNANERIDIQTVLNEIPEVIRLLEGKFNMIEKGTVQKCIYCGIGEYERSSKTTTETKGKYGLAFGMQTTHEFRALCCNNCGNIQFFRVDECKNKSWLDK